MFFCQSFVYALFFIGLLMNMGIYGFIDSSGGIEREILLSVGKKSAGVRNLIRGQICRLLYWQQGWGGVWEN